MLTESAYKRYHIAIIPPPEISDRAIEASESLGKLDPLFVLDRASHLPHISLYHAPFADALLSEVSAALHEIAGRTAPFLLRQETYYPDQGLWVGVRYAREKEILDLHARVIEGTKRFRVREDDTRYLARWSELSVECRRNIEDCGWSNAFTLFSPHMSFAKLSVPRTDILSHLPKYDLSFEVDHIALVERGEYGETRRIVASFPLSRN